MTHNFHKGLSETDLEVTCTTHELYQSERQGIGCHTEHERAYHAIYTVEAQESVRRKNDSFD